MTRINASVILSNQISRTTRLYIAISLALIMLAISPQILAQNAPPDAAELERIAQEKTKALTSKTQLEQKRAKTLVEIESLQKELISAAAEAETYEKASQDISARLSELTLEQSQLTKDIYEDRTALSDLLAALQRIERNPPPALAINPNDAKEAAQAARLLASISADLRLRAEQLSARLANLDFIRDAIINQRAILKKNEADVALRRAALKAIVVEKQALEKSIASQSAQEDRRIALLATEADDIRELIARFEAIARVAQPRLKPEVNSPVRQTVSGIPIPNIKPRADRPPQPVSLPPDTKRFADARGLLRAPTRGSIMRRYNAMQDDGTRSKGLTIRTRSEAQVIAPYAGLIEFTGAFKNYENVLILNVGDDYFILMTGLGETYGKKGQTVLSGEPVGLMPFDNTELPQLYIEIRKNGAPVNPMPWLGTAFARNG